MLTSFDIVAPNFKNLNNEYKLAILDFVWTFGLGHFPEKEKHKIQLT